MRVVAVKNANQEVVNIYGYGEMVGSKPCPYLNNVLTPKIILDSGEIVWGFECWWGIKEIFEKQQLCGRKINVVPVQRRIAQENIKQ